MEYVIDYEVLHGQQNEEIVKEVSVAAENVMETFHFKSPYPMTAHGSEENGLSWADWQLDYDKLRKTICEAVSGYAHLEDQISHNLAGTAYRNLEDFMSPTPRPQGAIQLQYAVP